MIAVAHQPVEGEGRTGNVVNLVLHASKRTPRQLRLRYYGQLSVAVMSSQYRNRRMLVYVHTPMEACWLEIRDSECALWVGAAAFDVTREDAERIRETFEPRGLRVEVIERH